jgi:hypothetical protein
MAESRIRREREAREIQILPNWTEVREFGQGEASQWPTTAAESSQTPTLGKIGPATKLRASLRRWQDGKKSTSLSHSPVLTTIQAIPSLNRTRSPRSPRSRSLNRSSFFDACVTTKNSQLVEPSCSKKHGGRSQSFVCVLRNFGVLFWVCIELSGRCAPLSFPSWSDHFVLSRIKHAVQYLSKRYFRLFKNLACSYVTHISPNATSWEA